MDKKIIADCGSTKIHWSVIEGEQWTKEFFTVGINPVVMGSDVIGRIFANELPGKIPPDVRTIEFYGAGCKGEEACRVVKNALSYYFPDAEIVVESDMLGACRALLGETRGVACILGTGANSCLYDGCRIVANVPPGGYILGDEGSGAWLGCRFAGDYIKGLLPKNLSVAFEKEYGLDAAGIIKRVYRPENGEASPNRFLASFAPFMSKHIGEGCVKRIVEDGFGSFFQRNVSAYFADKGEYGSMSVNFTGSIAYAFKPLLRSVAESLGYRVGLIEKTPMKSLVTRSIRRVHGLEIRL